MIFLQRWCLYWYSSEMLSFTLLLIATNYEFGGACKALWNVELQAGNLWPHYSDCLLWWIFKLIRHCCSCCSWKISSCLLPIPVSCFCTSNSLVENHIISMSDGFHLLYGIHKSNCGVKEKWSFLATVYVSGINKWCYDQVINGKFKNLQDSNSGKNLWMYA